MFEIKQKRGSIFLPPEHCILVGIPQQIRDNKKMMADLRKSMFQQPVERINSMKHLDKLIANS